LLLEILEAVDDEEIIGICCKIIRYCLRDESIYPEFANSYPYLPSLIMKKMARWPQSELVV